MPKRNSHLKVPDPMIMNKQQCEKVVCDFLELKGFEFNTVDTINDADLIATKNGWKLFIETRGNQAVKHKDDTVFDSSQISIHLAEQIQLLLKLNQRLDDHSILVMANPDIPRIRQHVEIISKALNQLLIIQFWVQADGSIQLLFPNTLSAHLQLLGLQGMEDGE